MSDETQTNNELDILKARARTMGITFSNNIKLETLKAKIEAKQSGEPEPADDVADEGEDEQEAAPNINDVAEPEVNPLAQDEKKVDYSKMTPAQRRTAIRKEIIDKNMKMVRIRIACLDPKKKDLPGEIITVASKYLGTVRKFVPFGEFTDNGYHVPFCIYQELAERRFLNIRSQRNKRTGQIDISTQWVKEFSIEVLPQLTEQELARLANAQAAAAGMVDA